MKFFIIKQMTMNKYKCIKTYTCHDSIIMEPGDIIITNEENMIYNITKGVDFRNVDFKSIKNYLNNISDNYSVSKTISYKCDNSNEIGIISNDDIDEIYKDDEIEYQKLSNFERITKKLYNTYKQKNEDYGSSFDKTLDNWGLQAAGIRMSDKLERFNNIVRNGSFKVRDESVIDTLEDLATYAIMTVMYLKK